MTVSHTVYLIRKCRGWGILIKDYMAWHRESALQWILLFALNFIVKRTLLNENEKRSVCVCLCVDGMNGDTMTNCAV